MNTVVDKIESNRAIICTLNVILYYRRAGSQELARMCGVPATDGASNGKVIAIEQHPENENFVLVGFSDGQIELHDLKAKIIWRRFDHSTKVLDCFSSVFRCWIRNSKAYPCVFFIAYGLCRLAI